MFNPMVYLKKNEDRRIKAGHLWIYSNEIDTVRSNLRKIEPGTLVHIARSSGEVLGSGYLNWNSLISIRLLSRKLLEKLDVRFFKQKIERAAKIREICYPQPYYRLVFGESDLLPGLTIDRFGDYFTVQTTTLGMERSLPEITQALEELYTPKAILIKNDAAIRQVENLSLYQELAFGHLPDEIELVENDIRYQLALKEAHKTGWYYDQRENRLACRRFVQNRSVLDVFSYTGSFSANAALAGAGKITAIDESESALSQLQKNFSLNQFHLKPLTLCEDAFEALKQLASEREKYDVIFLDPPAFMKRKKDTEEGVLAYLRLHQFALRVLKPSGILVSSSCSMHLSLAQLSDIVRRAALKEKKELKIFHHGFQGFDHPVHPSIPETFYLKTIYAWVA